jgi:hypothetical protein
MHWTRPRHKRCGAGPRLPCEIRLLQASLSGASHPPAPLSSHLRTPCRVSERNSSESSMSTGSSSRVTRSMITPNHENDNADIAGAENVTLLHLFRTQQKPMFCALRVLPRPPLTIWRLSTKRCWTTSFHEHRLVVAILPAVLGPCFEPDQRRDLGVSYPGHGNGLEYTLSRATWRTSSKLP